MKFRAKMNDLFCMRRFALTITTLSKLGHRCIVCLSHDDLCFVIFEEGVPKKPLAWCTLEQEQFFRVYNIVGISEEFNKIILQFSPEMFARAIAPLKMPLGMNSLKIRLTKKNTPCLTCEIEMTTLQQHSRTCIHDIPVEVLPGKHWESLAVPKHLAYDLVIHMPNMKRFKTICDKMKALGAYVTVEGRNDGIIVLKTEKDLAIIRTYFKELEVESDSLNGAETETFYSVTVDCKKLINFLRIEALNPGKVLCSMIDKKLLFMNVLHENVTLNYFIPGIAD